MIAVIIQARTGSTRFPRKIYEDIAGVGSLLRLLGGCRSLKLPDAIVLAMPEYDRDEFNDRLKEGYFDNYIDDRFSVYFGSHDNLIDRYIGAADSVSADIVVRITGDCPYGWVMTDNMIDMYVSNKYKDVNGFLSNNSRVTDIYYPSGVDNEIFNISMLNEAKANAVSEYDIEHCTPYMRGAAASFPIFSYNNEEPNDIISTRLRNISFDTKDDLSILTMVCREFDNLDLIDNAAIRLSTAIDKVGDELC